MEIAARHMLIKADSSFIRRNSRPASGLCLLYLSPFFLPYVINPLPASFDFAPMWAGLAALILLYRNPGEFEIAVLGGTILLSFTFAQFPVPGIESVCWAAILAALFLAGRSLSEFHREMAYRLFVFFCLTYGFLGLLVWLGYTSGDPVHLGNWALTTDRQSSVAGPFINRNIFGGLMACAFAISIGHWLQRPNIIWLLALGVCSSLALATQSRSVAALVVLTCILAVFILLRLNQPKKIFLLIATMLAAAMVSQLVFDQGNGKQGIQSRYAQTMDEGLGPRQVIWASAFVMWENHPLNGVGLGRFGSYYLESQAEARQRWPSLPGGRGLTSSAHNLPLHLLAETGILGFLLWLLTSFWLLKRFTGIALVPSDQTWPALMLCGILWAQSLFNLTLTEPYSLIFFVFFMGMSFPQRSVKNESPPHRKKAGQIAVFFIILLSTAYLAHEAWETTRFWFAFEKWLKTEDAIKKKSLADIMLANPSQSPYFVDLVARRVVNRKYRHSQLPGLMPWIEQSLSTLQMPGLYQARFLGLALKHNFTEACELGQFLTLQEWSGDPNRKAYKQVCQNELPQDFHASW
ncbi:MAG: O-antigen ligase domain-containing protein [Bacteroidetes bacterium]|nr:MAG: O-antigen ligase domain-containing protein [Bacteroidota bacterium]